MQTITKIEMPKSILVKNQTKNFSCSYIEKGEKTEGTLHVKLRFDDECGNGHNTFSMTGHVKFPRERDWRIGGCIHDEIIKHFPEFAHLKKWHLTSTDGPMHYVANTVFHASNRDCWGKLKGEPKSFISVLYFEGFPVAQKFSRDFINWIMEKDISKLEILEMPHIKTKDNDYNFSPKYTFKGFAEKWHQSPFDSLREAQEYLLAFNQYKIRIEKITDSWGEGKERDFHAARSAAVWPEATDEILSKEKNELSEILLDRLPSLMVSFKKDMETLGFIY